MKRTVIPIMLLLLVGLVAAADWTPTGSTDFSVYIDPSAELSGKVYATVSIDQSTYPGDAKCIDMLFYTNGSKYTHIQSNPKLTDGSGINLKVSGQSPEDKGYFDIKDGIGTIYFRDNDVIPYNNFTFVVLCNVGNTSLVYEEEVSPVWRVAFKSAPARGAWFAESNNADMIVIFAVFVLLTFLFIWNKFGR